MRDPQEKAFSEDHKKGVVWVAESDLREELALTCFIFQRGTQIYPGTQGFDSNSHTTSTQVDDDNLKFSLLIDLVTDNLLARVF